MKLNEKEIEILELLEMNSRLSPENIAKMVDLSEQEVKSIIQNLEDQRIIVDYVTTINWSKVDSNEGVTAMIDVKVAPKRGVGFDDVASRIYRFNEVKSVYLMSGAYDLSVVIEGRSMSAIAQFVSEKLSALDSVLSTTTHFILKKYKHDGTIFEQDDDDKRIVVSP
ncbi:Lrp/AsnC family transcriptional regulator [Metabacillus fastidiosus]|uniref:Lrp/AsnC family transcriptional regulator n=1 Tax=Metabacillus fastidiosus TaxID=1458 RepID=A0ABU6P101_9BACI|nr:Lrp/AsnC family transcriptional regulator [Metabacillus fastidiosus]MEC2078464.1 Lrp/AsnC family transcriptional regulator [Metabacillus fastidiosus]MED4403035.1 Lrp/AsnC family transcriptional regulator [Metabacillus fastidiosus]MED4455265.1 Lrp/AsnC family transcriptional regulator [Metabacillus fastidiosus]MED4461454.1 Lrp/AsnC family transcriptional regulator [Metabacillus fastidiosus]MED4533812.1 Lrp/AsnC family transcriptional regulator [Metabacillus fastidiosus]